jgi:hypothetical protein
MPTCLTHLSALMFEDIPESL